MSSTPRNSQSEKSLSQERPSWFLLVDCNQFFVSCEMVFNPKLRGKPVVVVSGQGGCVLARSKEAKRLGIPMGAPAFEWEELFAKEKVIALTCNHTLYSDLSSRVMQCMLEEMGSRKDGEGKIEIYSVDEAFLEIDDENPYPFAEHLRKKIERWTGIPVSIGIAKTKTLAKLCSEVAKNLPEGIHFLPSCTDLFLETFQTIDIWGIGKRTAEKLASYGIKTALNLKNCNELWVRKQFSVVVERTQLELKEISCLPLSDVPRERKSILCSRSFKERVRDISDLKEALSCYIAQAAETLRDEGLFASHIEVFLMTSRFDRNPSFSQKGIQLESPTQSSFELIQKGGILLESMYSSDLTYKKIGVILSDFSLKAGCQLDLFSSEKKRGQEEKACEVLDLINRSLGKNALFIGSQGISRKWKENSLRSPCYTTSWDEILTIHI